ncbi:MAG: glycine--tRNA ligase subunit beta [Methylococcales bacterium]
MTIYQDCLFELGTEELPPQALLKLRDALRQGISKGLDEAGLEHGEILAYATPRRLAVLIKQLAASQPDQQVERRGPPISAAYDADGKPTKSALGFAKTNATTVDQLQTLKTAKGEWLCFRELSKGQTVQQLLPEILNQSLNSLPIPKRMRWGDSDHQFVRPVHWLLLLYGTEVLPANILGLTTDRLSYGHRFHAPAAIAIDKPADYLLRLQRDGYVIAEFEARRDTIKTQIQQKIDKLNGIALYDDALLDEITALVEWPVALVGNFEEDYLKLPDEVLITTMQTNQKYVPVKDKQGQLLPHFITILNIDTSNPEIVQQGNERVIRPRLGDAAFFWNQDTKKSLEQRVTELGNVVEQKKLGSMLDKTQRLEKISQHIAERLNADINSAKRAAHLCKADLLTDMVGEFASLQGVMGRYYALKDGETEQVASALQEHYMPRQSGGELPSTTTGQIVSLADKLDTLVGIFSIGMIPTGVKDPYGLRRAALGLLRILIEKNLDLDLADLVSQALEQQKHAHIEDGTQVKIVEFLIDRLRGYSLDLGYLPDEFDAVKTVNPTRPVDFMRRLEAVQSFRRQPEADSLAAANKRIRNILRKVEEKVSSDVKTEILTDEAEKTLYTATQQARETVTPILDQYDYSAALRHLAALKNPIDEFFDNVMVMADDPLLKANRLALLQQLQQLFLQIADIGKLQANTT